MERVATVISPAAPASRPTVPSVRRARRGGFTLIEMLVAIGIILLLMTIGVLGFRHIERSNAEKATKSAMANATSLVKEMNAVGALALIETIKASANQAPLYDAGQQLTNPGQVAQGKTGRNPAIVEVQRVMRVLQANPKNKSALQNMPGAMLLPPLPTPYPAGYDPGVPVLIDAWGNPLVYVPSGGLLGVSTEAAGAFPGPVTTSGQTTSPQNRGYWASAGPDGDFATGDDNLYSFQL